MNSHPAGYERTLFVRLYKVYKLLLWAYPREFREEYASEMLLTFRDAYAEASLLRGTFAVLRLCCDCLLDLVKTAGMERARSWRGQYIPSLVPAMAFTLDVAERTDTGRKRARNEDSLVSLVPEDGCLLQARGALFVVADGMGGHGDVASGLAVQQVVDCYYQNLQDDVPTALRLAVLRASDAVRREIECGRLPPDGAGHAGTTCVAAVLHDRHLHIANVGDSRAYVLHDGRLRQVTRDHSLVMQLVERGELTPAEARAHPQRNLIYRALGLPDTEVDIFVEPVQDGDTIVVCSDGLCAVVEDEEIGAILRSTQPKESVESLIACANARGGPDNISAIVTRVSDCAARPRIAAK